MDNDERRLQKQLKHTCDYMVQDDIAVAIVCGSSQTYAAAVYVITVLPVVAVLFALIKVHIICQGPRRKRLEPRV